MTDFITFVGEEAISVEEYIEEEHKGKIRCICGKEVHFVNDSCLFKRKGLIIQKHKHFSHFKGEKCFIPKEKKEIIKEENEINNKVLTIEEKRLKRIIYLINKHINDLKTLNVCRENLKNIIDLAKYHKINYKKIIEKDEIMFKFYRTYYDLNIENYECISFKELLIKKIEPNKIYRINEIDYSYLFKKKNNNYKDYFWISSSYINKIILDFDIYCKYLKQLSLIIVYYSSRCNKEHIDNLEYHLKDLKEIITNEIYEKRHKKIIEEAMTPFINDDE